MLATSEPAKASEIAKQDFLIPITHSGIILVFNASCPNTAIAGIEILYPANNPSI